jgi:phosphatidylglycerol:prolipoprotein diacylglycerol transferase
MNPILATLGPFEIRWYGLLMALAFLVGYFIFHSLAKKRKELSEGLIDVYFIYIFLGIIIGARLGEVIFYDPMYYLANPIKIFYTWEGGLASHGAFIGGILATLLFCRRHKIKFYTIADIVVIPIALGAMFIRIGNLINGEIVGRIADISKVPWAMNFQGYEGMRHPVQIYEAIMNFSIFLILLAIRRVKKIPEGFVFWSFVSIYSFIRFFLEFFKDFQRVDNGGPITMGQLLCIVFFAVSFSVMIAKYRDYLGKLYKTG